MKPETHAPSSDVISDPEPARREPMQPCSGLRAGAGRKILLALMSLAIIAGAVPRGASAGVCDGGAPTPDGDLAAIPLPVLGSNTYLGAPGGLYPGGENQPPAFHHSAILDRVRAITAGSGPIGMISLGFSNPTQEFGAFIHAANADTGRNPRVVLVSGSQGGIHIEKAIAVDPTGAYPYWQGVQAKVRAAGLSVNEVRVAWIKEATQGASGDFFESTCLFRERLQEFLRLSRLHFPNLEIAYVASRIYAGYKPGGGSPEPYAYQEGFGFKWLIEDQIAGEPDLAFGEGGVVPMVLWGPYLWARADEVPYDDLVWLPEDFEQNGGNHHPSELGEEKVADRLLRFFSQDFFARRWWLPAAGSGGQTYSTAEPTDDTTVRVGDCITILGSDPHLQVQASITGPDDDGTLRSYVRFDLSSLSRPVERALLGLRIAPDPGSSEGSVELELVEGMDAHWDEQVMTGCSEPVAVSPLFRQPSGYSRGSYVTLDVTTVVNDDVDGVVSFRLNPGNSTKLSTYLSKEYEVPGASGLLRFPPQLLVVQ